MHYLNAPRVLNINKLTYNPNIKPSSINDCLSCRNTACYICNTNETKFNEGAIAYIVDQKYDTYEDYINARIKEQDFVLQPFSPLWSKILKREDTFWHIKKAKQLFYNKFALKRIINHRQAKPKNIFSWQLSVDENLAKNLIKDIPVECTHLVVSQNYLPFLYQIYAFAGRTYDVLMTRLPVDTIQSELDVVYQKYPDSSTLSDFRASKNFIELENCALQGANKLITPHRKISRLFNNSLLLDWKLPTLKKSDKIIGSKIVFPGSPLGRKGAYELRKLIKELSLSVTITGKAIEHPIFFDGLDVSFSTSQSLNDAKLIIYPAYIEHQPKLILKAIGMGIPVIISDACGIAPKKDIYVFKAGNYATMKKNG